MKEGELLDNEGLSLLEKGKKGFFGIVFSRTGVVALLFLTQLFLVFALFRWFAEYALHFFSLVVVINVAMVIVLLNSRHDPTAKITWLIVMLTMPVFGALLYIYTQSEIGHRAVKYRIAQLEKRHRGSIEQDSSVMQALQSENPGTAALVRYMSRSGCYPAFDRTQAVYFSLGEEKWQRMTEALEAAKDFIFMEYFIIEEGAMWGRILEILARKAKEGVEVRVMYDGMCEFSRLPRDYPARMKKLGIRCKVFAPLSPMLSTHYNYRDHRKILVIDGHTAFTGGVNLADEYINRIRRFGHWKDTALMLRGEAVRSFTLMFLQMWHLSEREQPFDRYLNVQIPRCAGSGYVVPYADCPLDGDKTAERVYLDILNRAKRYVHIMTPYLILDSELENALVYAAQRGVEVTLILPGVPDKQIPYALAKTYYPALMEAGVRIYEYTPGFVHAKVFVSDDDTAVVGTINLDYRSLYHHFECAAYLYRTDCIADIERDFCQTLRQCRRMTKEALREEPFLRRLTGAVLKGFAPLM